MEHGAHDQPWLVPIDRRYQDDFHDLDNTGGDNLTTAMRHPLEVKCSRTKRSFTGTSVRGSKEQEGEEEEDPLGTLDNRTREGNEGNIFDPLMNPSTGEPDLSSSSGLDQDPSARETGGAACKTACSFVPEPEHVWWHSFKQRVLRDFRVSGNIRVDASFLKAGAPDKREAKSVALSKSKVRLEHLEAKQQQAWHGTGTAASQQVFMTQKEYIDRVTWLRNSLERAWSRGERLEALKTSIQCAMLLSDVSAPQYYPSLWAQISDTLDAFAALVFERIKNLAGSLNFRAVSPAAAEMARSWFYKVAGIRELLPRMYLEMALLRCHTFIASPEAYADVLSRTVAAARGVGSPMVGLYCRAFLARMESKVWESHHIPSALAQERSRLLLSGFYDYLFVMHEFRQRRAKYLWSEHELTLDQYDRLHAPGIECCLHALGKNTTQAIFDELLAKCNEKGCSEVVFSLVLSCFPAQLYACDSLGMLRMIIARELDSAVTARILMHLAQGLVSEPPPQEQRDLLLKEAWQVVEQVPDISAYVGCCACFIELTLNHYSEQDVLELLGKLLDRLEAEKSESLPLAFLERICNALCESSRGDFSKMLANGYLIKLLDLFKSEKKTALCHSLLENFCKSTETVSDPVIVHAALVLARDIHDSLGALSFSDERRKASMLICQLVDRVDFGRDFEQHFDVLVECRASFCKLDPVINRLVLAVARLAARTQALMKGQHTRRTRTFVKSCMAFCHITIPSIENPLSRLPLLILCGQISLANCLLSQADTFFALAISSILSVPEKISPDSWGSHYISSYSSGRHTSRVDGPLKTCASEGRLAELILLLVGALLPVPGNKERGALGLLQDLLKAVEDWPHWLSGTGSKLKILIAALQLLAALGQQKLLITIPGVASNDTLYGFDPSYIDELSYLAENVCKSAIRELHILQRDAPLESRMLSLRLANVLIGSYRLCNLKTFELVRDILDSIQKNLHGASRLSNFFANTRQTLRRLELDSQESLSESRAAQQIMYQKLAKLIL